MQVDHSAREHEVLPAAYALLSLKKMKTLTNCYVRMGFQRSKRVLALVSLCEEQAVVRQRCSYKA